MLLILLILLSFQPLKASQELFCREKVEMWTNFKICLYVESSEKINAEIDLNQSFKKLAHIETWLSEWIEESELSKVNKAAGAQAVNVNKELFKLIQFSLEVAKSSDGYFDPSFNAFWGLYNFKKGEEKLPTEEQIKERLPLINYKNIILNHAKQTVFLKKPGMKLGLNAIGQGYGVDQVVTYLKSRGYKTGFVDGSGDTYFWGQKPNKELWTTGVRDPFNTSQAKLRIYGTDFAITTSGDDEKFFFKDGKRVHHLIDPKTGKPGRRARQATVIASSALEADAYDTACFLMGAKKCLQLAEKKSFGVILITPDKKTHTSKNLSLEHTNWGKVYRFKK